MSALGESLAWLWHTSNEVHVKLGLGHWLLVSGMLTVAKLSYASHRDGRREARERRAQR